MAQLLIPHSLETRARLRPGWVTDVVSPAPRDIWRGVLRDDPGAGPLQTPEYVDAVLRATGGTDVSRFYQLRDGRQLVVPLVRRRSRFGWSVDAGHPDGYGRAGILATGGLLADDVRLVVSDLREEGQPVRIGSSAQAAEQWSAGPLPGVTEVRHRVAVVDVERGAAGDPEAFLATRLDPGTRARLRDAARLGVEVQKDTTGRLVPVFHDIYRAWVERWALHSGLPPAVARRYALRAEPYEKLATVAAGLGDACRLFLAWRNGRPIAATILMVHGQQAVGWRRYSIPELADPVSADLLTSVTAITDAISSGCRSIDLGRSMRGDLQCSKSSLGASRRSVVDLRIEPAGRARLRAARIRAEGVLTRALTRPSARPTRGRSTP